MKTVIADWKNLRTASGIARDRAWRGLDFCARASWRRASARVVLSGIVAMPFAAALVGCRADTSSDALPPQARRDSAGVTIIVAVDDAAGRARLPQATRTMVIDRLPRSAESELAGVRAAAFLPGGELAVVQTSTAELLLFDRNFAFVRAAGQRGSGPGEFRLPVGVWPSGQDVLTVYDFRQRKLVEFTFEGALRSERRITALLPPDSTAAFSSVLAVDTAGRALLASDVMEPPREGVSRGRIRRSILSGSSVQSLEDVMLGAESYVGSRSSQGLAAMGASPLGQRTHIAWCGDQLIEADSHRYELVWQAVTGEVRQILREARPTTPLTNEHVRAALAFMLPPGTSVSDAEVQQARRMSDATTLPMIESLRCGPDSSLWVIDAIIPGERLRVVRQFDSEGNIRTAVRVPSDLRIMAANNAYLVGVTTPARTDAEQIEVWRVR